MRPIKFRLWDNVLKQMIFNSPSMVIRLSGSVTDGSTVANVELMQFTGLHDKDGKEIYEGDIVSARSISVGDFLGTVVFRNGCFALTNEVHGTTAIHIPLRLEVIGNVFENPELLDSPQPQAMSRDK